MDLIKLHNLMSEKGYHYFKGNTNNYEDNLYII